jgi:DNA polymerase-3 subunit gamma/tau
MKSVVGWTEKYRPKNLNDIIGHKKTSLNFAKRIANNELGQNILFSGATGVGKTTYARLMAKTINCTSPNVDKYDGIEYFTPCNECNSCKAIESESSSGSFYFFDGSGLVKDSLLEIKRLCNINSITGKARIIFIEEIQNIASGRDSALQALLKLIEKDYKGKVYFIMSTMDISKINKAVVDRFHIHERLKKIPTEEFYSLTQRILEEENLLTDVDFNQIEYATKGISLFLKEGMNALIYLNNGSVREYIKHLEECIYKELYSAKEIEEEYSLISYNSVSTLLISLLKKEPEFLKELSKMSDEEMMEFYYIAFSIVVNYFIFKHAGVSKFDWQTKDYEKMKPLDKNTEHLNKIFCDMAEIDYIKSSYFKGKIYEYYTNDSTTTVGVANVVTQEEPPKRRRRVTS